MTAMLAKIKARVAALDLGDLAARSFHTFWQSFTAVFGGAYIASGLDVKQVVDVASGERFILGALAAAGASALVALRVVGKSLLTSVGVPDLSDDDAAALATVTSVGASVTADPPAVHEPEHAAADPA